MSRDGVHVRQPAGSPDRTQIEEDRCAQCQDPNVAYMHEFLEGRLRDFEIVRRWGESKERRTFEVVDLHTVGICRRCADRERTRAWLFVLISAPLMVGFSYMAATTDSDLLTGLSIIPVPFAFGFILAGMHELIQPRGESVAREQLEETLKDGRPLFTPREVERNRKKAKRYS